MHRSETKASDVLHRIVRLQGTIAGTRDTDEMRTAVRDVLLDVPGVAAVDLRVSGPGDGALEGDAQDTGPSAGRSASGAPTAVRPFPLGGPDEGTLYVTLADAEAFAPYRAGVEAVALVAGVTLRSLRPAAEKGDSETAAALRRSERRYRRLVEASPDAFAIHCDGKLRFVNPAGVALLGARSYKDLLGRSVLDFVHPDFLPAVRERVEKALGEGGALPLAEETFLRVDGTPIQVEVVGSATTWEGRPAIQILARDVTERARTVAALQRSEEQFRALATQSEEIVFVTDKDGIFTLSEGRGLSALGLQAGEVVGQSVFELYADYPELLDRIRRALDGETVSSALEVEGLWFRSWYTPRRDASGQVEGLLGLSVNVTAEKRAEQALQASEQRANALLEGIPDLIFRVDRDGVYLDFRADDEDLYVRPAGGLIGKRTRDIAPPAFADMLEREIEHVLDTGEMSTFEYSIPIPDRGVRDYEARLTRSGEDEATAIVRDVTERNRTTQALARERRIAGSVIRSMNVGTWEWNLQTGEAVFNARWAKMLGYTLEEVGRRGPEAWNRLYHPDDLPLSDVALQEHLAGEKEFFDLEARMKHKDGRWLWVHDRGRVLSWTDDGQPLMMYGTLADITERKAQESALKESEAKFRSLAEDSQDLITRHDAEGRYLYMNPAALAAYGLSDKDILGLTDRGIGLDEEVSARREARLQAVVATGEASRTLIEWPTEWGTRYLDWRLVPETDEEGRVATVLGIARDVTEQRLAEESRVSLERQIQRSERLESLGVLAGGIAHDFNNILAAVLGHTELAMAELGPAHPVSSSLRGIQKGANRAAQLTRQMLAYSGQGRLQMETLDLSKEVAVEARALSATLPGNITLDLDVSAAPSSIRADDQQIRQALTNLFTNAIDAIGGERGTISVKTGLAEVDAAILQRNHAPSDADNQKPSPGSYVLLEVSDTGCGMDDDTAQRIFEPFFSTKFVGRGLGMAALMGIVKGHGGVLTLDTELGRGSTFRLYFPDASADAPGPVDADEGADAETAGDEPTTVLVVDDEEQVRGLVATVLTRSGHDVLTAADGPEAIAVFEEHGSDIACVFLDVTMPKMSGQACLAELRRIRPDVKVVVMSGYAADSVTDSFTDVQPDAFIEKPFSVAGIRERLDEVLRGDAG